LRQKEAIGREREKLYRKISPDFTGETKEEQHRENYPFLPEYHV